MYNFFFFFFFWGGGGWGLRISVHQTNKTPGWVVTLTAMCPRAALCLSTWQPIPKSMNIIGVPMPHQHETIYNLKRCIWMKVYQRITSFVRKSAGKLKIRKHIRYLKIPLMYSINKESDIWNLETQHHTSAIKSTRNDFSDWAYVYVGIPSESTTTTADCFADCLLLLYLPLSLSLSLYIYMCVCVCV